MVENNGTNASASNNTIDILGRSNNRIDILTYLRLGSVIAN